MKYLIYIVSVMSIMLLAAKVQAHEMVPTYPKLNSSYMEGLQVTTVTVFNKRPEVEYYEIGVFDDDWNALQFVSQYKIYKVPHLSTVSIDIYIRNEDKYKVSYICSKSKLRKADGTVRTAVSSRICSRVKKRGE